MNKGDFDDGGGSRFYEYTSRTFAQAEDMAAQEIRRVSRALAPGVTAGASRAVNLSAAPIDRALHQQGKPMLLDSAFWSNMHLE